MEMILLFITKGMYANATNILPTTCLFELLYLPACQMTLPVVLKTITFKA